MKKKICSTCKAEKDISEFSFRSDVQRYRGVCRSCSSKKSTDAINRRRADHNAKDRARYTKTKKKPTLLKNCEICQSEFATNLTCKKYCSSKCNQQAKIDRNRQEIVFYTGNCVICNTEFTTDKKRVVCCSRKCSLSNWTQNNKEQHKQLNHNHYIANKSKYRAKDAKRRGIEIQAHLDCFVKEYKDIFKNNPKDHHVDHIIPLNHPDICGLDVYWNFQYLTASDNLKKSNKFDGTNENESWRTK